VLDLLNDIKMHLVFHTEKLYKVAEDFIPGQDFERPLVKLINGNIEYKVDKIFASKI